MKNPAVELIEKALVTTQKSVDDETLLIESEDGSIHLLKVRAITPLQQRRNFRRHLIEQGKTIPDWLREERDESD